ncbi:hypothetical protein [Amycolatopsis alba]|uniref:Uncharacterized protein n=1 Tax=Amycolatopsis alba DSM 44262 TaxID=1125972 RepID=A0A229S2Q2_AMYAL|nr:hypothetical protein [Amycolatopsis alba]OXM53203.1 hypothetical protein CFP75_07730 [Amycolatopsis alba DSM 44262]
MKILHLPPAVSDTERPVPRWIPFLGGKPVRLLVAAVPAVAGGLILTALFSAIPLGDGRHLTVFGVREGVAYLDEGWEILARVCIAPLSLWGPITIVLGVAYHLRRR